MGRATAMSGVDDREVLLKKRLEEIARKIAETKERMPAHSAKPPLMKELFGLEEAYDELYRQLEDLKKQRS